MLSVIIHESNKITTINSDNIVILYGTAQNPQMHVVCSDKNNFDIPCLIADAKDTFVRQAEDAAVRTQRLALMTYASIVLDDCKQKLN